MKFWELHHFWTVTFKWIFDIPVQLFVQLNHYSGPPQALSYWGGSIFQNRAPLKKSQTTSFRKSSRLVTILDNNSKYTHACMDIYNIYKYIYIHIYTYIYIYIYIYILYICIHAYVYVYVCICICIWYYVYIYIYIYIYIYNYKNLLYMCKRKG